MFLYLSGKNLGGFHLSQFWLMLIFCVILNYAFADGLTDAQLAILAYKEGQKKELARDWKSAIAYYEEAVKRDEQNPQYHYKLAFVYTRQNPPPNDKAIRILKNIVKRIDKKHKESHALLGFIYLEKKDIENAKFAFGEAAKIDSNFALSYYGLGKIAQHRYKQLLRRADKQEAITHFQRYLKLDGDFAEEVKEQLRILKYGELGLRLNRAIALIRHGEYHRAKKLLDGIANVSPSFQEVYYWRGLIYSIYDEATPYYDETGKKAEEEWLRAPDIEAARIQLGIWYYETEQFEKAERQLKAALQLNRNSQKAYYYLGLICFDKGQKVQALHDFKQARESQPEGELARQAETWIELINGGIAVGSHEGGLAFQREQWALVTNRILASYGEKVVDYRNQERLERILKDILRASNVPQTSSGYSITIIDSDEKNAWSLPNGQIFISKGTLQFVQTQIDKATDTDDVDVDDVLAFILGHEITHIVNRDVERSSEAIGLIKNAFAGKEFDLLNLGQSFSRVDELYADKNGALLAYRAEYNPIAAIDLWSATIEADGDTDFVGDYPSLKLRKDSLISYLSSDVKTAYGQFGLGVKAMIPDGYPEVQPDYTKAIQKFRHFLAYFPYDKQALNNIGVAIYQNALSKIFPPPFGEWKLKFDLELRISLPPISQIRSTEDAKKEIEEAIYYFELALQQDRRYKAAHLNLANVLQGEGKIAEAEEEYLAALQADEKYELAHNGLGVLYYDKLPKWKDAIKSFRQALKYNPKFLEAQYNLALTYQKNLRRADAIREWEKYLEIDREGFWTQEAREHLEGLGAKPK